MNAIETYAQDARAWLARSGLWCGTVSYTDAAKAWLARSGHYLDSPPPGALLVTSVERLVPGLFGMVPSGGILGMAVLGRPIARNLPQNGTVAELTRFVLSQELPHQTASHVLRVTAEIWFQRHNATSIISYHDRSRHSGCIYKKAGFRKNGHTRKNGRRGTWASRPGREQGTSSEVENKRRWILERATVEAGLALRAARAMLPGPATTTEATGGVP